jgi:hypothetical protein
MHSDQGHAGPLMIELSEVELAMKVAGRLSPGQRRRLDASQLQTGRTQEGAEISLVFPTTAAAAAQAAG